MLVARDCCLANAFSTGLKLIWPRSSLKITKISKKRIFLHKDAEVNGLTTISEVIAKGQESCIQQMVDDLATQARADGFQLNERKCKELRISFAKNEPEFDPIRVNRQTLETVNSVKLLGLNISSNLKWNAHVSELVRKVSTRLYFLRQLKKSHVATRELLLFYITCIRSILEYGSPVFHRALPSYLSEDLERLQKTRHEDYLPRAIVC